MAYRTVEDRIWTDPKFRQLEPDHKYLFLYLFTNPHAHLAGIYYLPRTLIKHETGMSEDQVVEGIDGLYAAGLSHYDYTNETVWVVNMFRYQAKGQKAAAAASKQLQSLHNTPLIEKFLSHYDTLSIPYRYPIDSPSPQEQEQEQNQIKKEGSSKAEERGGPVRPGLTKKQIQKPINYCETMQKALANSMAKEVDRDARKQTPLQMIVNMCLERNTTAQDVAEFLGITDTPYSPEDITRMRHWLQDQPRLTDAEIDARKRNTGPGSLAAVGDVIADALGSIEHEPD